jgi:large subunit ribosomal protein L4
VLLVLDRDEDAVWKSFRNLGVRVQIVIPDELNTYDVLVNDWLVFSKATLEAAVTRFSTDKPSEVADADAEVDEVPVAIGTDGDAGAEEEGAGE